MKRRRFGECGGRIGWRGNFGVEGEGYGGERGCGRGMREGVKRGNRTFERDWPLRFVFCSGIQ